MFAHMHLRGRDMTFFAEYPSGQRVKLLQIPNFNFDWQLAYEVRNPLPAGTTIEAVAHFDNSRFNPFNPDPARDRSCFEEPKPCCWTRPLIGFAEGGLRNPSAFVRYLLGTEAVG